MLVNLINKHGPMLKKCFPESYSCEASTRMNSVIKSKLREYAKDLRQLVADGATDEEITEKIRKQMSEIYNVFGICLGIPPEKFTWECYDKSKKYLMIGPIQPIDFYGKYVNRRRSSQLEPVRTVVHRRDSVHWPVRRRR
ncbi:bleomycin hydrolase-like [Anopheles darlingi]|uniref:bleomycin hydrolase-like n=1 Tax=Anopheles darlingi TaxID=43151 RepID=UPI002100148E|nr:bleomycin hydrolase-like [Anopheles darlingi]